MKKVCKPCHGIKRRPPVWKSQGQRGRVDEAISWTIRKRPSMKGISYLVNIFPRQYEATAISFGNDTIPWTSGSRAPLEGSPRLGQGHPENVS